ncbi:MAG: DAK2 domain-containing protein [Variovorax sp.]
MNAPAGTFFAVDGAAVKAALGRWCDAMVAAAPKLNALDGRLGDGDLGTTLQRCAENIAAALPALGDEPPAIFKACAAACAKASGSSFGTLLAVGFLTAAKSPRSTSPLDRDAMAGLLDEVLDALRTRGGAALGDKTMLDSLDAVARALREAPADAGASALQQAARAGAAQALDALRDQPNKIGRARMFAQQSIGADDPGMVAVQRMTMAL